MTELFPKHLMYGIVKLYRGPEYDHVKYMYNFVKREFGQDIANKFFVNHRCGSEARSFLYEQMNSNTPQLSDPQMDFVASDSLISSFLTSFPDLYITRDLFLYYPLHVPISDVAEIKVKVGVSLVKLVFYNQPVYDVIFSITIWG